MSSPDPSHPSYKHGKYKTPEYQVWANMIHRCTNPNWPQWSRYGGRGISVCNEWREFTTFIAAMGPRPSDLHVLDRIDNDGNYEPGNCRWATRAESAMNRENTRWYTVDGETLHLFDWAKRSGIDYRTIYGRISNGWPIKDAVSVPPRSIRNHPGRKRSDAEELAR